MIFTTLLSVCALAAAAIDAAYSIRDKRGFFQWVKFAAWMVTPLVLLGLVIDAIIGF